MTEYESLFKKLEICKNEEIENIDKATAVDIKDIKINKKLKANDRIIDYLKKAQNPYILKINDTLVKITYGTENVDFKECLKSIVRNNV